jgi:hypothetical protein
VVTGERVSLATSLFALKGDRFMLHTLPYKRVFTTLFPALLLGIAAFAQNPQLQERLGEIKQAAAANKQALAQYTWQEQQTVSIKGEVKKQELFQVQMGPDGKPQKTPIGPQQPPPSVSGGRLKQRVVAKKKEEFQDYAHEIAALAQSYAQPDPERLQQAFQQGNLTLGSAGAPGEVQMAIANYIKPNDSVQLVFSQAQKAMQSLQISSYLSDPKDAVTISVQFSKLPDGTNHVSTSNINGVSKQLTVAVQNSNYQKM